MVICLELGADLHMAQLMPLPLTVSCFSKIQIGFTFLLPAHLGSPGKRAIKQVCVCVCVTVVITHLKSFLYIIFLLCTCFCAHVFRQQKKFQLNPESYNGAVRDSYSWSQSITDVDVHVKV